MSREIPAICSFDCPCAEFPPAETAGICRTMSAVCCTKLNEIVSKNVPCEWRRRTSAQALPPIANSAKTLGKSSRSRRSENKQKQPKKRA